MGDHFERIVDVEVTAGEAGPLAERMVDWPVSEGVITRETHRDAMYSLGVDEGYRPGPRWAEAVLHTHWEPAGVMVVAGRRHHVEGQGEDEPEAATCPRCAARTVVIDYPEEFEADEEVWGPFEAGIAAWEESGAGSAACPACGAEVPVTEWDFGNGFALGALAFDFWGWPPLSDGFLAEFAGRLGHRTVTHTGKF